MLAEVLDALSRPQKELPCKYLYDEAGSRLYDQICELAEYYPARTEMEIMRQNVGDIANMLGPKCLLIEYGSGSSEKTRILLSNLEDMAGYVPIDISKEHLLRASQSVRDRYPNLEVMPVCADYTNHIRLPIPARTVSRHVVYFPGSTIGNFEPDEAVEFLKRVTEMCGPGDGLLIGVDLQKDPRILAAAYDDRDGVTARFNLNLLSHVNSALDADFDLTKFRHRAVYHDAIGRVEMHLVSECEQVVHVGEVEFDFGKGETIWTESSYKYTIDGFADLAKRANFEVHKVWTDAAKLFSVQYLCR